MVNEILQVKHAAHARASSDFLCLKLIGNFKDGGGQSQGSGNTALKGGKKRK